MNTFYSIIKIAPNSASVDAIAIGLIAYNGSIFKVKISNWKIGIAKRLLNNEKQIIDLMKKQILEKISEINQNSTKSPNQIFNSSYFAYLANYSNGMLQFTAPNPIDKEKLNEEDFENLYQLMIDNHSTNKILPNLNLIENITY
jgi:hypothetical protein